MELRMINVGFGDCFIILDDTNNVSFMIDFGSRGYRNSYFNSINKLAEHIKSIYIDTNRRNYALITHFHLDHYSGFNYLSKHYSDIFDAVYIPYLNIEDKNSGKIVLLELAIYYYLFLNKTSYTWRVSKNILKQIKIITTLAKNNNVICLSSWDKFSCSDRKFQVIWPDKEMNFKDTLIKHIIQLDNLTGDLDDFNELKSKILHNMKKWYEYTSITNDKDSKIYREQIDEIIQSQELYLKKLDKLRDKYSGLLDKDDIYHSFKYYSTRLFSRSNNSASIVFHDKVNEKQLIRQKDEVAVTTELNNLILMTGDIEASIVNEYLIDRFHSQKYHVLKAPHHGTQGHYTENLPEAQNILISTGPRRGYSKICEEYKFHIDTNGRRSCTSGNIYCDIISNLHTRCNKNNCQNDFYYIPI